MKVGVPKEIKPGEGRVALTPHACHTLVHQGVAVTVQSGAGAASGYADAQYGEAGASVADSAAAVWAEADLVVKVKEPQRDELGSLRPGQQLFCFLHLAADPELAEALVASGATCIGFETVTDPGGGALPLLAPMSTIAGRLAGQLAPNLLHHQQGGRGLLLGGIPGAPRGSAVVLGAGSAGMAAARSLADTGAAVTVFDLDWGRLEEAAALGPAVTALYSGPRIIGEAAAEADVVVGAVLVAGRRAPLLVDEATVAAMPPGAVLIDISVDQGGCVATTRPTSWKEPTYTAHGVVHFAVTNMPGAVPRTASQVLAARLTPYVAALAGVASESVPGLEAGYQVRDGEIVHAAVREALAGQS